MFALGKCCWYRLTVSSHDDGLRGRLLASALEFLQSAGPEGLSLREIARSCGVSQTAPYHYFRSKEELLAAVAEEGFRRLSRCLLPVAARGGTAAERLTAGALAYVRFAVDNPAHYRVMFGPRVADPKVHAGLRVASESTYELFRSAVAEGARELGSQALGETFALTSWSMLHGVASLMIEKRMGMTGLAPRSTELLVSSMCDVLTAAALQMARAAAVDRER